MFRRGSRLVINLFPGLPAQDTCAGSLEGNCPEPPAWGQAILAETARAVYLARPGGQNWPPAAPIAPSEIGFVGGGVVEVSATFAARLLVFRLALRYAARLLGSRRGVWKKEGRGKKVSRRRFFGVAHHRRDRSTGRVFLPRVGSLATAIGENVRLFCQILSGGKRELILIGRL